MSTQEMIKLKEATSTVVAALLLLATAVQSATQIDRPLTTLSPAVSTNIQITQHQDVSMEEPRVLLLHTPCGKELDGYCENGGQCMYPQDSTQEHCICKTGHSGVRCDIYVGDSRNHGNYEEAIGVGVGVAAMIFILAIILFCCLYHRCKKPSQMKKSHQLVNSV